MSESDLESLPPEIARVLAVEKLRPDPPAAMQSRVLAHFPEEVVSGLFAGPGVTAAATLARATPLLLRRLPLAVTMLAVGGLGGAGVHALLARPVQTTVYVAVPAAPAPDLRPTPPPAAQDPAAPAPTEHRRQAPAPRRAPPPVSPSAPPPASPPPAAASESERRARDRELAAERALIEQARTALSRGKPADALVLLARHRREYASGQLVEEREALEILSFAATGQTGLARTRAAGFKQAFPKSLLLRAIDDALAGAP